MITSFKTKILLLLGTALAAFSLMSLTSVLQERRLIIESRQETLVTAVQSATSIVAAYQAKAAAGTMSQDDAKKAANEALRLARYGGPEGKSEYFYVFTTDGTGVMHPFKKEWEGQNMVGKVKDSSGVDIIGLLVNALRSSKDGKAFVPTMFTRPGQQEMVPKLQYVEKVESGTKLVGDAGTTMNDIVESVQRVADMIGEIRSATSEQSQGIAQVNTSMSQLDQMTQQNSALVEESTAAAESLREQAVKLTQVVALFRVDGTTAKAPVAPAVVSRPAYAAAKAARPGVSPTAAPRQFTPSKPVTAKAPKASTAFVPKTSKSPAAVKDDAGEWENF